jgi:hypothetical protein
MYNPLKLEIHMIILVANTYDVLDKHGFKTGRTERLVSHGYCVETGQSIIMQQVPPEQIAGSMYDTDIGEWVLQD